MPPNTLTDDLKAILDGKLGVSKNSRAIAHAKIDAIFDADDKAVSDAAYITINALQTFFSPTPAPATPAFPAGGPG